MATLALSVAGQFVGGMVGGPIGATIGRALGALAGSAVDAALFAERPVASTPNDIALQGSSEGGVVPRLYGWNRMTGNIIWATELEEIDAEDSGAKGTADEEAPGVAASFAVAFCEGAVHRLGRVWADGELLETEGLTLRFYRGSNGQVPDSLIEAKQGVGKAPAYRGICYIVFERLALTPFGNRIPNISVELCRVVGELEPAIRAVTVIPGATEFGYDPSPRVRVIGPGATANENTHQSREISDWTLSIDELQALCPNLESVALVVAWFGNDLRCGECVIEPKVEAAVRQVEGAPWSVAGVSRSGASVMSSHDGGPAYGGTPSDGAVLAAIADLKARGIKVTLYPMLLMDIPPGNGRDDPYGWGSEQMAYPWRGRITCDPAPGRVESPDTTGSVDAQVAAFAAGFSAMTLHYAGLAVAAGGIDALIIGSEMRGMTTLRGASNSFPFVEALVDLAADVRAVVGSGTKLTYAADWSEYSGYQPGGAQKFFHLDPLWASDAVDAVGIDNYMPVSDWRDGQDHADALLADRVYDADYLDGRIAGGEGFDWYYGSDADRLAGLRSPIGDGAYGEPWVWRYKDLVNWWGEEHHDRPGGVRNTTATDWVPKSKPIWFTELGCGAVDKGANQPNVFGDAKSAEDGRPYYSTGTPDPLMQRQFLRAHLGHWGNVAGNPVSPVYDGPMVDAERIYLWTWDARPYPAFPGDLDAWKDGVNHPTGHWLSGRLGAMATDELAGAIAGEFGLSLEGATVAPPLVHGLRVEGMVSARDALAGMLDAAGLTLRDGGQGLELVGPGARALVSIDADELVAEGTLVSRRSGDSRESAGRLGLRYLDRERAYLTGTVTAMRSPDGAAGAEDCGLVLDLGGARTAAERLLADRAGRDSVTFKLPPEMIGLEVGDIIALDEPLQITEIRDGLAREVTARTLAVPQPTTFVSDRPRPMALGGSARAMPLVFAAHLPPDADHRSGSRLVLAGSGSPWPDRIDAVDEATGAKLASLVRRATMGVLESALAAGDISGWDEVNTLTVRSFAGHLSSKSDAAVLAGGNRLAVQNDGGDWEILAFADAELSAPGVYELSRLRRGLGGSDFAIAPTSAGNRFMLLDARCRTIAVPTAWLGSSAELRYHAGVSDLDGTLLSVPLGTGPVLPLAPADAVAATGPGSAITLSWTRRSRFVADGWSGSVAPLDYAPEAYQVKIYDGATLKRTLSASVESLAYSSAQQTADFGGAPAAFDFTIAQVSAALGAGHLAHGRYEA